MSSAVMHRACKSSAESAAQSELLHFCKAWQVCMQRKMQEEEEARVKRMQLRFKAPSQLTQVLEGWWDTSMNGAKRLCHNIKLSQKSSSHHICSFRCPVSLPRHKLLASDPQSLLKRCSGNVASKLPR